MSERRTAIVLCEDLQSQVVLYRLLSKRWGKRFPRVRLLPLPAGKEAGSKYVLSRYAAEVAAQRSSPVNQVLVVHVDGDNVGRQARADALAAELSKAGLPARGPTEPIAHVIPCWETETWILYAQGESVTESAAISRKFQGHQGEAAEPLVDLLDALTAGTQDAPPHLLALVAAVPELRRL